MFNKGQDGQDYFEQKPHEHDATLSSKLTPDSLTRGFYLLSFDFHRFALPYRESGLRVVTPPEWIIFL